MAVSERVQKARKAAQIARLKKKGSKDYPEYYANQPLQRVKAAANKEIRRAKQAVVEAREDLEVAEITGEGLESAQEALVVTRLVVEKLEAAKRESPGAVLSSAGAM